jgi:hypothetical protein
MESEMEWIRHDWRGPAADVEAALRALGWTGPDEEPGTLDARVGALLPAQGTALRVLDGWAYAAFLASEAIAPPVGVLDGRPELSVALLGTL